MGNHWYSQDGSPCYQVPYADASKGMRDTTLGDAKKLNLVPSVTTILGIQDKPGLTTWLQQQTLKAAWENPPRGDYKEWCQHINKVSKSVGEAAAKRGSQIHDALESFYTKGGCFADEFIEPIIKFMEERFPNVTWVSEESFTSKSYGFGGRIDLYSPEGIVLDFKTKDTADIKKMVAFDDHHMQTAAYAVGLSENNKIPTCDMCMGNIDIAKQMKRFNLFISTHTPGLITLTESTEFDKHWEMFYTLNKFWQIKNNFGEYSVR